VVSADKVTLECPNCHWLFEAKMTDKRHSVASLVEPQKGKVMGDIIEENRVCRNPKCKRAFTIYWFEPLQFFQNVRQGPHLNPENEKPRNTKRTSLEIISDILKFCSEPRSPTKVMYETNLSYKALKTYLAKLCSLGLLGQNSRKYVTTEKGRQFVLSLKDLENMLGNIDSSLKHDSHKL